MQRTNIGIVASGFTAHLSDLDIALARSNRVTQLYREAQQPIKRKGDRPLRTVVKRPGRNELCPCGSGLKFKRCCAV